MKPSTTRPVMLPGHSAPAAGFEAPFEMLATCHERVNRMLRLQARLQQHLRDKGCDEPARQAARDVMRYFDLAAPHHHQDEELHVLPPLLASDDAAQRALAEQLVAEHRRMEALWAVLRGPLQQWAEAPLASTAFPQPEALAEFTSVYADHIAREEGRAYPLARTLLDTVTLSQMGAEMSARRRTPATGTP